MSVIGNDKALFDEGYLSQLMFQSISLNDDYYKHLKQTYHPTHNTHHNTHTDTNNTTQEQIIETADTPSQPKYYSRFSKQSTTKRERPHARTSTLRRSSRHATRSSPHTQKTPRSTRKEPALIHSQTTPTRRSLSEREGSTMNTLGSQNPFRFSQTRKVLFNDTSETHIEPEV
eukprot:TRINITY_DN6967_c0_g1_i1.p1 TRINITY_DN6967_c0_g1~~TRINITY_DN6967_c0_g1_i1.p1  ORF type:complete len:173 (+),score=18.53 TRINITY_DN6967_c0_g1_i1:37-555(+)